MGRRAAEPGPARARVAALTRPRVLVPAGAALAGTALVTATALGAFSTGPQDRTARVASAELTGAAATGATLPPTRVAAGSVVPGFPRLLLPLPAHSAVTASAVERQGALLEVSLSATTAAPAAAVLQFYSAALTRAGFHASAAGVLATGTSGLVFSRGDGRELIVLAIVDRRWNRSYSIGGTVAGDG